MLFFHQTKTFASSNFKLLYEASQAPMFQDELIASVRKLISCFCEYEKLDKDAGINFFLVLQKEAFETPDALNELLGKIAYAAQR